MKKIKNLLLISLFTVATITSTVQAKYYHYLPGTFKDEQLVNNEANSLNVSPGQTAVLEAQWIPAVEPKEIYTVFNNKEQYPDKFGHSIDAANGMIEWRDQSSKVNYTICPKVGNEVTPCSNKSQKNAGEYYITVTTKNPNEALISKTIYNSTSGEIEGFEGVTENKFLYLIDRFPLNNSNTIITIDDLYYGEGTTPTITSVKTDLNGDGIKETEIFATENINGEVKPKDWKIKSIDALSTPGKYKLTIEGIGNYKGSVEGTFELIKPNFGITGAVDISDIPDHYYTGKEITPAVSVKNKGKTLIDGTDYTVSYQNNINVGTATAVITGKGNYAGTATKTFKILPLTFDILTNNGSAIYNGNLQTGGAKVEIAQTVGSGNPVISYGTQQGVYNSTNMPSFKDVGKHSVYFKVEKNGYTTKEGSLTIEITKNNNLIKLNEEIYTGNFPGEIKASFTTTFPVSADKIKITSKNPTNFTYQVSVNGTNGTITIRPKNPGNDDFKVEVVGDNNLVGSYDNASVVISSGNLTATSKDSTFVYDGRPHTFEDLNINIEGAKVVYSYGETAQTTKPEFTDAGTYIVSYTVSKEGYDTVYGMVKVTINPKPIRRLTIVNEKGFYPYNGNEIKPEVEVFDEEVGGNKLVEGKDYILHYSNNILPGTGTVTAEGINNYEGQAYDTFNINSLGITYHGYDGKGEYTGYEILGSGSEIARVDVTSPSKYKIAFSKTKPACLDSKTCTLNDYKETKIPRFKNVGVHTVYYRIEAEGYTTISDSLTITITKKQVDLPKPFPEELQYTGAAQSPTWIGYNSKYMSMSGALSGTQPGNYKVTFKINEPNNIEWRDTKNSDNRDVYWAIKNQSIKDHETIKTMGIDYDEWKQINIDDAKTKFERPGYNQIGWVDTCVDTPNQATGITDRTCNYSNVYDVGSSVFGAYVANKVNYNNKDPYDLYAVWSRVNYNIDYELCDSKGCGVFDKPVTNIVPYNTQFIVPNPKRPGYIFTGWDITNMDKTSHVIGKDTTSEISYSTPEAWTDEWDSIYYKNLASKEGWTVKFTAKWEPIKFDLKFDANVNSHKNDDGDPTKATLSGNTPSVKVAYDEKFNLSMNGYKLNGYNFSGKWMVNPDVPNNGEKYNQGQEMMNPTFIDWKVMANEHWNREKIEEALSDVRLYALWNRRTNQEGTKFVVNYWKEKIDKQHTDNPDKNNYDLVASSSYTGESDARITITPYSYDGKRDNKVNNDKYVIDSSSLAVTNKNTDITVKGLKKQKIDTKVNNDFFKGFKAPKDFNVILSPNGDTVIDLFYERENYVINFYTHGGGNPNTSNIGEPSVLNRDYQVKITFKDGIINDKNLLQDNGNTGKGVFAGWFKDSKITTEIIGIDGNVIQDLNVYAKWLQYRYSGAGGNENSWTQWGLPNE